MKVDSKGYLVIQLTECYGTVSVHASSTYGNLIDGKYDIKVTVVENLMYSQMKIRIRSKRDIFFKVAFADGV